MKTKLRIFLALLLVCAILLGGIDLAIPDVISFYGAESNGKYVSCLDIVKSTETEFSLGNLTLKKMILNEVTPSEVIVGGVPFGVKLFTEGLLVVGFSEVNTGSGEISPAKRAGIKVKDIITHLNGKQIKSIDEFTKGIEESGESAVEITFKRRGKEETVKISPEISNQDGKYKVGMWLRDSTSGIGTVTFIVSESGEFAGLGHGICDGETGEIMPLGDGTVMDVVISGVVKGVSGTPGELKGYFSPGEIGKLNTNTDCGVTGKYTKIPDNIIENAVKLPIGLRSDLKEGKATIRCTLDDNIVKEYEVVISGINESGSDNKNFVITVTDPELIEKTGGIVQGMSGSPIIQGGKLVGAVTHVLINDPTRGYGIFIENMLASAR